MESLKELFHGSDVDVISNKYRIAADTILPYASNVNPLGMSTMAKEAITEHVNIIETYPERNYSSLRSAIGNYCGCSMDNVILGNGTSELIRTTIHMLQPKKTLIVGPTYGEYARAAKFEGSEVETIMLSHLEEFKLDTNKFMEQLNESIDLVILCNPNNPTSTLISRGDMGAIIEICSRNNIFVLIDETYIEFVNNYTMVTACSLTKNYENLIVLRSTSKFFACPGLRLGYGITSNKDLLKNANSERAPWNINSYASIAATMFSDEHYINLTSSLIHTERNLIYSALCSRKTIKVFKPEANFVLIRLLKEGQTASEVFDYCIGKGIMIRDCTDYEGLGDKYVRMCFLKPEQNDIAVNTILEIV